ncbi:MAG: DUF2802 domain-containing protein [Planctomycetes bacterium]|nr:DUF2802 domain-containing protein [Planctomycetota bacterium]
MDITITWRELSIAVVLAAAIYLLEVAFFSQKSRRRAESHDEPAGLRAEVETLKHRLGELEVRLGVAAELSEAEPAGHAPATDAYDYAVQYAREGMAAPDIAVRCGISRDEAALIVAMQRRGREA